MDLSFSLAPIFSDGAVLQREQPIYVFGHGPENGEVTISLAGLSAKAVVQNGAWRAALPELPAAQELTLEACCRGQRITVKNIAVGEVWIAGGQSNMEFWLRNDAERDTVIPNANDPLLRFFDMPRISYDGQEKEIPFADFGVWRPFLPEHAGWFSAVGAYFGQKLRQALNVPVAIVGCNCGATSASCWLDEAYLEKIPELSYYRDTYENTLKTLDPEKYAADFRARQEMGLTQKLKDFDTKMARGEFSPEDIRRTLAKLTPRQMELFSLPCGPMAATRPFALYHNMVERLAPYSAKGVIWYQGESDEVLPEQYARLFGQMVSCWRDTWGRQLPFLTVQLAPFGQWLTSTGAAFPTLRRQQEIASETLADVWMASIMDGGMEEDIHPKNKRIAGERLALLARGKVYGESILCEPPAFAEGRKDGNRVNLRFRNAGTGLVCKGSFPRGLEILADGNPTACTAELNGDVLTLTAPALADAEAVEIRYAQAPYVEADLYSSIGLCAKPFTAYIGKE